MELASRWGVEGSKGSELPWTKLTFQMFQAAILVNEGDIQCLVGEEQNFVIKPMLHGKPMQFSQHRANMVKLVPLRYNSGCIILKALQLVDVGFFALYD